MDFNDIKTDELGEYVLDQHGSKHRKAGTNSWTLSEADMTQEHKDFLQAQSVVQAAEQESQEAEQELKTIDLASIRGLREYVLSTGFTGTKNKDGKDMADLEAEAVFKRAKL